MIKSQLQDNHSESRQSHQAMSVALKTEQNMALGTRHQNELDEGLSHMRTTCRLRGRLSRLCR